MNAYLQQLEARRMKAARYFAQGKGIRETARLVNAAPSSVYEWKRQWEQHGIDGLRAKPHPGPAPRLDARARLRLEQLLLKGARAAGYLTELWTCPRVTRLIERNFGVRYHPAHVSKMLHSLGWSCQKPEQRARERDDSAIRCWREHDWPRIKKELATAS